MKISIDVELHYRFASNSQIVASLEASLTPDQHILQEMLTVAPGTPLVRDSVVSGDRRIRGCFNGDVVLHYTALVENKMRQLRPPTGRQHEWSELPIEMLSFLLSSRFCPSDLFMRFVQREFGHIDDGVSRLMATLKWIIAMLIISQA